MRGCRSWVKRLRRCCSRKKRYRGAAFKCWHHRRNLEQLKILGITKVGQVYYINGMQLSENQTYSVATSDRLANTTSDFPQLAQVDLDNPNLFPARGRTVQIADIGLRAQGSVTLYAAGDLEGAEQNPATKGRLRWQNRQATRTPTVGLQRNG